MHETGDKRQETTYKTKNRQETGDKRKELRDRKGYTVDRETGYMRQETRDKRSETRDI